MPNLQPKPKFYPVLASRYWDLCLINVRVEAGRLFAGFAYCEGSLPDTLEVRSPNGQASYTLWIPEAAKKTATHAVMTDKHDRIEFKIA